MARKTRVSRKKRVAKAPRSGRPLRLTASAKVSEDVLKKRRSTALARKARRIRFGLSAISAPTRTSPPTKGSNKKKKRKSRRTRR